MIRLLRTVFFVGVLILCVTNAAYGQTAPTAPSEDMIGAVELSAPQQQSLEAWLSFWTGQLSSGEPSKVEAARMELVRPFTIALRPGLPGPSLSFRSKYSQMFVPKAQDAIKKASYHTVANVFRVLQEIGTEPALRILLDHADPLNESQLAIRLAAGAAVQASLKNTITMSNGLSEAGRPGLLDPRKIIDAFRSLKESIAAESNPNALTLLFGAGEIANSNRLEASDRIEIRGLMVAALGTVVERINDEKAPPSELIEPAYNEVGQLRAAYVALASNEERQKIGLVLGPVLGQLLGAAKKHWDVAKSDTNYSKMYGGAVDVCESLLKVIDAQVRGEGKSPKTELKQAWEKPDPVRYGADVQAWLNIVTKSPYTPVK